VRRDVLDHGYLELVESWGSDERVVEAARMSTGKGFLGWGPKCDECGRSGGQNTNPGGDPLECSHGTCPGRRTRPGDEKLLRYLYENRHDTPFEMAGMIVEVRAPIFVFREWHRHRVPWSYNEASARYAPLPALDYVPTPERMMRGGGHLTKQAASGEGAEPLTETSAERWAKRLRDLQTDLENHYQKGLQIGVPKELARLAMTVGRFSTMRASANLRGWLHFLGLRDAPNAQEEIRVYAQAAGDFLRSLFPRTMALHDEKKR
jgi:thymidylate synthase (FAD)